MFPLSSLWPRCCRNMMCISLCCLFRNRKKCCTLNRNNADAFRELQDSWAFKHWMLSWHNANWTLFVDKGRGHWSHEPLKGTKSDWTESFKIRQRVFCPTKKISRSLVSFRCLLNSCLAISLHVIIGYYFNCANKYVNVQHHGQRHFLCLHTPNSATGIPIDFSAPRTVTQHCCMFSCMRNLRLLTNNQRFSSE